MRHSVEVEEREPRLGRPATEGSPTSSTTAEWHLTMTATDSWLPVWGVICGFGLFAAGGWIAIGGPTETLGFGVFFVAAGVLVICVVSWIYCLRGVRRVYEREDGSFQFVGPYREVVASPGDVWGLTYWYMSEGMFPYRVRTAGGSFFLPVDLSGPSPLLPRILRCNPDASVARFPL
jgi:hypothetical protein